MKQRADLIIRGSWILPMADDVPGVIESGAVAVTGGVIVAVGPEADVLAAYTADRTLGGEGRAVLPGFVNTHTHAAMVYLRGLADDLPLKDWLEGHIWPAEAMWLDAEFVRDAVGLACIEMLRAGITSFADMYFFEAEAAPVVRQAGMRAVLGAGVIDFPTKTTSGPDDCLRNAAALVEQLKGDPLLTPSIAAHSAYTCSPDTLRRVAEFGRTHGVPVQVHLAETEWERGEVERQQGQTPVRFLESIGFFEGTRVLAPHCVWVDEGEIDLLARRGVGVSHCIKSNLKLASGIAPVPAMLRAGLKVGLGTDGAASNNALDVMSEMNMAALVHKSQSRDATAVNARTALRMATRDGARAAGLDGTGTLQPGMLADITVVNMEGPHLSPLYDVCSHLVYAARSSDVEHVVVGGRVALENGRVTGLDEAHARSRAAEWSERIKAAQTSKRG
jgi:5-methylthioadenosine/S-adenosylhomocysteine deaminase